MQAWYVRAATTLALMRAIGTLSLTPATENPERSAAGWIVQWTPSLVQNAMHVVLYGVLTLAWHWTLSRCSAPIRVNAPWLIAVTFGALLEWLQTGVPGRFGNVVDVGLNGIGALSGAVVWMRYDGKQRI